MSIQKFTDLHAWQEAHKLTLLVYKTTGKFPLDERFGLTSQIRRAIVSVESCIAEGFNRYHYKDRLNFYYDARGSLGEVQSQTITAYDLKFIPKEDFTQISELLEKVNIILGGLIRSTENLSKK